MRLRLVLMSGFVLAALSGCGAADRGQPNPDPGSIPAAWERLPDHPLSPRQGSLTVWTGKEILVIGGETGEPCPPNVTCDKPAESAADGAAFDPVAQRWRRISDAPMEVPTYTSAALVAGHVFLRVDETLIAYDVEKDRWKRFDRRVSSWLSPVADGDRLLLVSGSDEHGERPDLTYDVATDRWDTLPADPIGPAFDRMITATPAGLVLTAKKLVDNPGGGDRPSLVLAAVLEGDTWRRLPDSDQLGGWRWAWTGRHLVDPTLGRSNGGGGGEGDYGRWIPNGGLLDPATGRWSRLPNPPEENTGGWGIEALGGPLVAAEGWVYDDATGSWFKIPRPEDGAEEPGPGVWVGNRLVVVGGLDYRGNKSAYVTAVWAWEPETRPAL
jgi:hypothetical protein